MLYAGDKYSCYDDDDAGGDDAYNRKKKRRRKLGGEQCPDGEKFECYDDAGYTNVNQVSILCTCLNRAIHDDIHLIQHLHLSSTVHEVLCKDCNEDCYIQRHGIGFCPSLIGHTSSIRVYQFK